MASAAPSYAATALSDFANLSINDESPTGIEDISPSAPTSFAATVLSDFANLSINDESPTGIDNEDDDDLSLDGLEENDDNGIFCVVSSRMQWMFEIPQLSSFRSAAKSLVIQDVEKAIPLVV
jgi:hypothetical protein